MKKTDSELEKELLELLETFIAKNRLVKFWATEEGIFFSRKIPGYADGLILNEQFNQEPS